MGWMVNPMSEDSEIRIAVFICSCGVNIAGNVNVDEVVEYSKTLPNVVVAQKHLSYCTTGGADAIKACIKDKDILANRLVMAA